MVQSSLQQVSQYLIIVNLFLIDFGEVSQDFADDFESWLNKAGVLLVDGNELYVKLLFADFEALLDRDANVGCRVLKQRN